MISYCIIRYHSFANTSSLSFTRKLKIREESVQKYTLLLGKVTIIRNDMTIFHVLSHFILYGLFVL